MTARKYLSLNATPLDRRTTKYLESKATSEVHIFSPPPMTVQQLDAFAQMMPNTPELAAVAITYLLGQRISDILLISHEDISFRNFQQIGCAVAITIRRGKVIPHIGPYTLFLAAGHPMAKLLLSLTPASTTRFLADNISFSIRNCLKLIRYKSFSVSLFMYDKKKKKVTVSVLYWRRFFVVSSGARASPARAARTKKGRGDWSSSAPFNKGRRGQMAGTWPQKNSTHGWL